jgi:hypothetical protein
MIAANLIAIGFLVFAIYFPRYRNREMVVAYLGINIGVMAIATTLATMNATVSVGLGLFGVLSIIRLRSDELSQREVAYYFASLALGLLGGVDTTDHRLPLALMALIVIVLAIADHPVLFGSFQSRLITIDRAFVDETAALEYVSSRLERPVTSVAIRRVDLVNDTTLADVRFRIARDSGSPSFLEIAR